MELSVKLKPVNKSRLHEEIVTQIQDKILDGELKCGDRLPAERELAADLNVNRATLREALKKLELLGLVEINHGDGVYVRDYLQSGNLELLKAIIKNKNGLNTEIMMNLLLIRRIVATEMAAHAAQNRNDSDLAEMKAVIDSGDSMSVLQKDLKMHHIIARAGKNTFYIFLLNFFNTMFEEYGSIYFNDPDNQKKSLAFHRDIYNAIKKGDSPEAKKIMHKVLLQTEIIINNTLKKAQ